MAQKFVDLFSGVGGFRLGLEARGFDCVFSSEIDKYARAVYEYQWERPEGDIREIDTADIPDHDILCGGVPCQPFSIAGKRKGFQDIRGTLFEEIVRVAQAKRPGLLFLENVKGLLSADDGRFFLPSSYRWQSWGILSNGKCLTARISESHSTENGSSLSDILEKNPDEKYFLSEEAKEFLKKRIEKNKKVRSQPRLVQG